VDSWLRRCGARTSGADGWPRPPVDGLDACPRLVMHVADTLAPCGLIFAVINTDHTKCEQLAKMLEKNSVQSDCKTPSVQSGVQFLPRGHSNIRRATGSRLSRRDRSGSARLHPLATGKLGSGLRLQPRGSRLHRLTGDWTLHRRLRHPSSPPQTSVHRNAHGHSPLPTQLPCPLVVLCSIA
jgi:hypothetical protein